jgi:hypothetical protein
MFTTGIVLGECEWLDHLMDSHVPEASRYICSAASDEDVGGMGKRFQIGMCSSRLLRGYGTTDIRQYGLFSEIYTM